MNWRIDKSSIDKISDLRNDYFNSIPEFQELYLELMIDHSDCYIILFNEIEVGYGIRNKDGILIEFYVKKKYVSISHKIFIDLLIQLSISTIYCKSFDSLLLVNCLLNRFTYSFIGILYRDYAEPLIEPDPEIIMVRADLNSEEELFSQDDSIRELFETREQLTQFISKEHVFKFVKSGELVGCGMVIRTTPDREFCDLGVWVHPSNRGQGIGARIIMGLRDFALQKHMKPSCGCAIENIASQKTIEKSGFVSRYNLIRFLVSESLHNPEKPV